MQGFAKLAADRAYATGAVRSNLGLSDLVAKLRRAGLGVAMTGSRLVISCDGEEWTISRWQPDGVGRIGWIDTKVLGDAGELSRRLARAGVRHRFEYSRPFDMETSDVRSVTSYDYRWSVPGLAPPGDRFPEISMYDEQV